MELLVPRLVADLAVPAITSQIKSLNPSLLLDRFPERAHLEDQKNQKVHLDRVTKARPWKKEDYKQILDHLVGKDYIMVTARSRIALHLSRAGGLENANCCLHPVYGFAYLPGSGLKGLAHAYAAHLWGSGQVSETQKPDYAKEIEDIFGWAPNSQRKEKADFDPRSGRAKERHDEEGQVIDACRGQVVFHDAFGLNKNDEPPELEVDVLTCHYPNYYMKGESPGDWQSPVPVTFLTIAAGTTFRFRVAPAHSGVPPERVEAAKRLLLGGLYWLGAGAKTAAGYGAFNSEYEIPEAVKLALVQAEKDKKMKAAAQALDALWPTAANHALWVPKNIGSNKGFRLTRQVDGLWTYEDGWDFGKNVEAPTNKELVFLADINPAAVKRLGNPRLQVNVLPPPGRPK